MYLRFGQIFREKCIGIVEHEWISRFNIPTIKYVNYGLHESLTEKSLRGFGNNLIDIKIIQFSRGRILNLRETTVVLFSDKKQYLGPETSSYK